MNARVSPIYVAAAIALSSCGDAQPTVPSQLAPAPSEPVHRVTDPVLADSTFGISAASRPAPIEVIQEKRQIRHRRRAPKKRGSAVSLEIIRGDDGPDAAHRALAADPSLARRAGQLTAGEWRDVEHWDHWLELATPSMSISADNFSPHVTSWGIQTPRIYPVVIDDADGGAVCDAEVELRHETTGRTIWRARTDNRGRAWLFDGLGAQATDGRLLVTATAGGNRAAGPASEIGRATRLELAGTGPANVADVMFVVDTTSSMADELEYLQNELQDVLKSVEADHRGLRLRSSVNFYRDHGDEYLVRPYPFTSDLARTRAQLSEQSAHGGGDEPEAVDEALADAIRHHAWSKHARARLLFLVLDAPPHGAAALRMRQLFEEAAAQGIRIVPVVGSGLRKSGEYLMRAAAVATGGTYVFLTDDSGIGNAHAKPTAGPHDAGYLNDLLRKLIGEWVR